MSQWNLTMILWMWVIRLKGFYTAENQNSKKLKFSKLTGLGEFYFWMVSLKQRKLIQKRLRQLKSETKYYNPEIYLASFALPDYLKNALKN